MKDPVLLKSNQFAIPKVLRKRILDIAHQHHFGIVKTKWLMREKVWWQGMDQDVEHLIKSCHSSSYYSSKYICQILICL